MGAACAPAEAAGEARQKPRHAERPAPNPSGPAGGEPGKRRHLYEFRIAHRRRITAVSRILTGGSVSLVASISASVMARIVS